MRLATLRPSAPVNGGNHTCFVIVASAVPRDVEQDRGVEHVPIVNAASCCKQMCQRNRVVE